jgi:glycosyltransferase involved in cell wall biosynthesis
MTPDISIIMPVFNAELFLRRSLISLLKQSHKNIEILCINDGSTDKSAEILQLYKLKDSRIKIFHKLNSGPGPARNIGLLHAKGKYIMFCDADDQYCRSMCAEMLKTIVKNKVDLAICQSIFIIEKGFKPVLKYKNFNSELSGFFNINKKFNLGSNVIIWNKIFKRSIIKKFNILFPNWHTDEDTIFCHMYTVIANSVFFIQKKLYKHSIYHNSLTQTRKKQTIREMINLAYYSANFLKQNNLLKKYTEDLLYLYQNRLIWTANFFKNNLSIKNIVIQNIATIFGKTIKLHLLGDYIIIKYTKKKEEELFYLYFNKKQN